MSRSIWISRFALSRAAATCAETEHWAALAGERYGLVSTAGGPTVSESCRLSDLASSEGTPLVGECAPTVKDADTTCLYIGADPVDGGLVRVTAILVRSHIPA